jgi:hypothetical protein
MERIELDHPQLGTSLEQAHQKNDQLRAESLHLKNVIFEMKNRSQAALGFVSTRPALISAISAPEYLRRL